MSDKSADTATAEAPKAEGAAHGGAAKGGSGGGGSWLPLIVTLVAMPALAFAATKFMIVPQIQKAVAQASGAHGESTEEGGKAAEADGGHGAPAAASGGHGAPAAAAGGHGGGAEGKEKPQFVLNKLIVNVAGTMGTRLLMSSITLVGSKADFKAKAEEHVDQLKDLAGTALANKTIAEIEKPGFRNQIRSELITVFNEALGEGAVREVYLTEFAIQ